MQTTTATGSGVSNPGSESPPQSATVRFFLTLAEFKEGSATRQAWMSNRYCRFAGRIICAFGVYFFIVIPSHVGEPWPILIRTEPRTAIVFALFIILDAYVAIGMPGIDVLNGRLNRFDLQREITLTKDYVRIDRGQKRWVKKWKEFVCFYESPTMYVLQCIGAQFWTVPKRAFEPGVELVFRNILEGNLRRR